jgi:hypothetical protein
LKKRSREIFCKKQGHADFVCCPRSYFSMYAEVVY